MLENNNRETSTRWGQDHQSILLKRLCSLLRARKLEYNELQLMTRPSVVLIDAAKSGNAVVVKWLLDMDPELMTIKDPVNGRNLLHYAILYRQHSILKYMFSMETVYTQILATIRAVDNDGNNALHFAAHPPEKASLNLRPNIQMHNESKWFKEVEKRVPPKLRAMRNNDDKTPNDVFNAKHTKLSSEVKEAAKGIANSGMLVATLIATVAFAAALTDPGDKTTDDKAPSAWFIVFILTNAVALFTSSASIVSFLSIFTSSRFTESEFIRSLHPSLILGLALLFISIVSMVISFAAASFLIFDIRGYKWVACAVASLGLLPILTFLVLQSSLFHALRDGFFIYFSRLRVFVAIASWMKKGFAIASWMMKGLKASDEPSSL